MKPSTEFKLQYDPAEITTLAEEYMKHSAQYDKEMEDAGKRIATGDYSRSTLEIVCRWKSDRRIALLSTNTDLEIERALTRAISADDIKDAVHSLTALHGVGVKMASAILTAIDPERYTVLDFRALDALGLDDNDDLDFYVLYVGACRRLACTYEVTLRTFDRANWQWSKRKAKHITATGA